MEMTMRSLDDVLEQVGEAGKRRDYDRGIVLAREARALCTDPRDEKWFWIRSLLAAYLLERSREISPDDVEEAIAIGLELLSGLPHDATDKRARAQMTLGGAYFIRPRGNRLANLYKAKHATEAALAWFSRETDAVYWACLNTRLGLVYSDIEEGNERDRILRAIQCLENASQVFTASEYPEESQENRDLLLELKKKAAVRSISL
jgi:hypothetical protein